MSSSESGGVGSALIPRFERRFISSDGCVNGEVWGSRRAIGEVDGECCVVGGGEATTMSAAPESQARGDGSSSRQPLKRTSATVQLMFRLGGVPMGSANAADSRRHARAGSSPSVLLISKAGGNEKDKRKDSMLCKTRLATELRGRGGSRCTRRGLIGGLWEKDVPVTRLLSESPEPRGGVGGMEYMEMRLNTEARLGAGGRMGGDVDGDVAATRNGRLIVVTRMACLRRDLSDMLDGRKLTRASKGRWDESADGRARSERRLSFLKKLRFPNDDAVGTEEAAESRCEVDETGEGELLLESWPRPIPRNLGGGVRAPKPSCSHSASSLTPMPPTLRHTRATRSAHSRVFTKRMAPACSKPSGSIR